MTLFDTTEPQTPPVKPEPVLTTREISRMVSYYSKKIRLHSVQETRGVFRLIAKLMEPHKTGRKPLEPQQIADAIKNYEQDQFVQSLPQQRRKHIRTFFTYENIVVWMKPQSSYRVKDQSVRTLAEAEERFKPIPLQPAQPPIESEDEPVEF